MIAARTNDEAHRTRTIRWCNLWEELGERNRDGSPS